MKSKTLIIIFLHIFLHYKIIIKFIFSAKYKQIIPIIISYDNTFHIVIKPKKMKSLSKSNEVKTYADSGYIHVHFVFFFLLIKNI